MSLACEAEIGVQNELALRFTIVSKPTPILEYIKTISSLVGASHILAVFEENDTLKVFFDEKRFTDTLIRSGIHVMGHHVRVDYVVPPGTKIILSNIDPVVSNFDLMRLLSIYGSILSPIIRPPISDDMEFCHISYGVRYCYMTLHDAIPSKLEFKYGDQLCIIKIRVGEDPTLIPFIKPDICDQSEIDYCAAGPSNNDVFIDQEGSNPVVVSVESNASESNSDLQLGKAKLPIKRRYVKRKGRQPKTLKIKRNKVTATTRAAKKIKQNVKHKWIGGSKRMKPFKRAKRGRKPLRLLSRISSKPPTLVTLSPTSSSDVDDTLTPPLLITESTRCFEEPLSQEKLELFIEECKHNRTPIELAKKYLGTECNATIFHSLIMQIENYSRISPCHSLKSRLSRLCKLLSESLNNS